MFKSSSKAPTQPPKEKSWKVLVIEDDARWRTVIEMQLQTAGHTVMSASDGLAGLAMAAQKPDVILCDIEMPRLNGFGVLEALRQQPGLSDIPFIFLTARTARADQRKGMVLGADDYLTKPFEYRELLDSIAGVMAKRESLAQRLQHYTEEYRREMSAPWAHELLTPLNGILGIAAMLESEAGTISHKELRELARSIRDSARRQQALARKLMQHFQLEQFRESGWKDPAAAMEAGSGLEDEVLGTAELAGRASDLRLECAPAAVRISPTWLRAAVRELAENAFKFSAAGTPVLVSGATVDGIYQVEVLDQGPGMTLAEQEAIGAFRQFGRARHEQQGLGLGLAIVRNVAQLHQGSLSLEPGPNGVGLRARLELPLAE
ncbi:MAG: response regulator [Opitutaceae bacterium]|nr:response regulator [Opitutaceae bacterium]